MTDMEKTQESSQNQPHERTVDSKALFGDEREITISHREDLYRLSITKLGKLILTK
ncbi:hypothetical protein PSE_1125 [Pseudovibrio sp. FO-BEG1]|uniref:Hemin uptake protein hemP n=1 Tax=Pseudovibrio denitrificans TaxID=258256 RepID=A0A1I7CN69_9HYPH|nr:hemin uptake protein HemP [Pseudovibrio denitrificans]AEV35637.1 hypothetical protein PSE_1125 [Pseudovibrio sp. FO-BEG1]SFU00907.1 Hemin uptake protein hemP [Pseudovibrio denitrificans]